MKNLGIVLTATASLVSSAWILGAQEASAPAPAKQRAKRPPRPGVSTPGVKRDMEAIKPIAVFPVEGTPDWQVVTDDAVWVANGPKNTIHKLDSKTNTVAAAVEVGKRPCSGLAWGFGSIWVPLCGDQAVARVDEKTEKVVATIPAGPANSEGGITTSKDAVWMASGEAGDKVVRINPKTNKVVAEIPVAAGSHTVEIGRAHV